MAESGEIRSVSDITDRWPGIVDHDVEQAADFIAWHLREDDERVDEILQEAEGPEADLLFSLARAASWRLRHRSEQPSREEFMQAASDAIFSNEQNSVIDALRGGDEELAEKSVRDLFGKWPVELAIRYSPSPLFPEGREAYVPLDLSVGRKPDVPSRTKYVVDCHGEKVEVSDKITEYFNRYRDSEPTPDEIGEIQAVAERFLSLDDHEYQKLRETYGTKAATLFILDGAISAFRSAIDNKFDAADFEVPKFTAAPVDLHRMYKEDDPKYEEHLEEVRQQAIAVTNDRYDPELYRPLVAVRSSAVLSEDGEDASGAGIYASVSADPRDPESFRKAVEEVFDSVDTDEAKAYRSANGVDEEQMGLLIQRYIEDTKDSKDTCLYGYIQSSDPFGRLIRLSSKGGELLFDRNAVEDRFMVAPPFRFSQPTFHYNPDHNKLISSFSHKGAQLANAALFAEKLFEKQVELEFALDDSSTTYVVQVRPLPRQERPEEVTFPTDVEPLVECRAIGVGDVIVAVRDNDEYGLDEFMFDWLDDEENTGKTLHKRDKRSVFVIGFNDAISGHIQMLARERGQICLYPNALTALPPELSDQIKPDRQQSRIRKFRVVADGYRGAIYPYDEERNRLLKDMANNIAKYITLKPKDI